MSYDSTSTVDAYVSRPPKGRRHIMPLGQFPPDHREHIIVAALGDSKPPKWLIVGGGIAKMESRAWYEWHWHRGIDPDSQRTSLSSGLRDRIIERDGLVCRLCGGAVERLGVDIDHILPVSLGGTDEHSNLQVTHSRCNRRKGNRV